VYLRQSSCDWEKGCPGSFTQHACIASELRTVRQEKVAGIRRRVSARAVWLLRDVLPMNVRKPHFHLSVEFDVANKSCMFSNSVIAALFFRCRSTMYKGNRPSQMRVQDTPNRQQQDVKPHQNKTKQNRKKTQTLRECDATDSTSLEAFDLSPSFSLSRWNMSPVLRSPVDGIHRGTMKHDRPFGPSDVFASVRKASDIGAEVNHLWPAY
jgi:hypothetical protein